jgi:hypothetical protein
LAKLELTEAVLKEIERQVTENVLKQLGVSNGIHANFQSTGIQDNSTNCQVTILDQATVIENHLVTTAMTVKGPLTVEGDIQLLGEMPVDSPFYKDLVEHSAGILKLAMDGQFFLQYADKVFEKIKEEGLELSKIKLGGYDIADWLKAMTESAITIKKTRRDVSTIGAADGRRVVLSSNSRSNIVLEPDGSATIEKLGVGAVQLGSAPFCPDHAAERGSVMFNENADGGQPVGWVCLGNKKWAPFGVVDNFYKVIED